MPPASSQNTCRLSVASKSTRGAVDGVAESVSRATFQALAPVAELAQYGTSNGSLATVNTTPAKLGALSFVSAEFLADYVGGPAYLRLTRQGLDEVGVPANHTRRREQLAEHPG